MPHIQITMLEGRTTEQRRRIAQRVTQVLAEEAGANPEATTVVFVEVPRDCWARNGVLVADREK